jgi:hypothetical protein
VLVIVLVCVGVLVGVLVLVGVSVGVTVFVGVGVAVTRLVGVGVTEIGSPTIHPSASIILTIKFISLYGDGTSNSYGNTDTDETNTQLALKESQ